MFTRMISSHNISLYFLSISIIAIFDLYNSIVRLKPDQTKKKNGNKNQDKGTLTLIYLSKYLPNLVVLLVSTNSPYSSLLPSSLSSTFGLLIFSIGFLVRQIAIVQLGKFYTYKVSIYNDHQMIDTGLYAWMRHPAYSGTFLELTGAAILYNHCLFTWIISTPYLIVILKRIQQEEKSLIEKFGRKYETYIEKTGMFLPKISSN